MPRLKDQYREQIVPAMMERFHYANVMQVPRLEKVVVNIGAGEALQNAKALEAAANDLATITGQKAIITRAHKSIANFRLREGNAIGVKVTLRGDRMYEFLDRLITIALPRIRDFRGLNPSSFDGRGSYSLGVTEQTMFPEIHYDEIERARGMDITIVTSAKSDAEARALLLELGLPLRTS